MESMLVCDRKTQIKGSVKVCDLFNKRFYNKEGIIISICGEVYPFMYEVLLDGDINTYLFRGDELEEVIKENKNE